MDRVVLRSDALVEKRDTVISHYGMPRRSGRYPWGSGENPYQRTPGFRANVDKLTKDFLKDIPPEKLQTPKQRAAALVRAQETIAKGMGMSMAEFRYYTWDDLKSSGASDSDIAEAMGMSLAEYRSWRTIDKAQQTVLDVAQAWELKEKGYSNVAIAERMGYPDTTIRNLLAEGADLKAKQKIAAMDGLKERIAEVGYIDVGADVNRYLGISKTEFDAYVRALKDEGYNVFYQQVKQAGTGLDTTLKVLTDQDYPTFRAAYDLDPSIVKSIGLYQDSLSDEITPIQPPRPVDSSRIFIQYGDQGGSDRDGLIEFRATAEDCDLGGDAYAQVRVSVDGTHYMKGMAIPSDRVPEGYDFIYNTNKPSGTPPGQVFKKQNKLDNGEVDVENPFGAVTDQIRYIGKDGKEHLSVFNKVNGEGTWEDWSKTLASQFLSKQSPSLAKQQLKIVADSKEDELKEILSLNNPTVKRKLLQEYADSCDSEAEHLKGAALPRQATRVIIPVPEMKDTEIYAPSFRDGEKVVLVRYPHAGPFESPELVVNNKNPAAKKLLKGTLDAVGINAHVAERLSGADFDGDNVLVIPNNDGKIRTNDALPGLTGFDPKVSYKIPHASDIKSEFESGSSVKDLAVKYGVKPDLVAQITTPEKSREKIKNAEMGKVSNLITDMTLKGASADELERAVKHSMVVIDSVKHNLDYKASYVMNNIKELQDLYQAKSDPTKKSGGASTLISRASGETRVNERKEITSTRDMTPDELEAYNRGERVYRDTGRTYTKSVVITDPNKMTDAELARYNSGKTVYRDTGKVVKAQTTTTGMQSVKDARELSSGTIMEDIYAEHANRLKALANKARAELRNTPRLQQNPSAKSTYKEEVESLTTKLNRAKMNAPLERQTQLLVQARVKAQIQANPSMSNDSIKKAEQKALQDIRNRLGSSKKNVWVDITDREWEAIQAGAISDNILSQILNNTDMDKVKQRATPREKNPLSESQLSRIEGMYARGLTQAEIADQLGISTSTVNKVIGGL